MRLFWFFLTGYLLVWAVPARAQVSPTVAELTRLDLITPDLPAFKALGTEPSNLLRPSDVKQIAVATNPFLNTRSPVIPSAFGLEVAPWKLASRRWALRDYLENDWKAFRYRCSFSLGAGTFATQTAQLPPARASAGFRTSWVGRRYDVSRNPDLVRTMFAINDQALRDSTDIVTQWRLDRNLRPGDRPSAEALADLQQRLTRVSARLDSLQKARKKAYAVFEKQNWNAPRTDFALAWVGGSGDSLVRNVAFAAAHAWLTQSIRAGENGQFLLGGNARFDRVRPEATAGNISLSVSGRYYVGTADFRGFLEGQFTHERLFPNSTLVYLGGELRVKEDFWLIFSTGLKSTAAPEVQRQLLANLELRFSIHR
jgi:hypothetical protein